jgi:hypothetical protein
MKSLNFQEQEAFKKLQSNSIKRQSPETGHNRTHRNFHEQD